MEYKRTFLLRCCNTAIVRFRAQLIAYREPLCKWERGTPSGRCSPVGTWFGKQSLACSLAPFCPIGWVPWCNAQMAPPEVAAPVAICNVCQAEGISRPGVAGWVGRECESMFERHKRDSSFSFLNSEVILKR